MKESARYNMLRLISEGHREGPCSESINQKKTVYLAGSEPEERTMSSLPGL